MIRNYLNYAGSKDRYYPQIREFLVKAVRGSQKKILFDLFCGSGVVAFNSADLFKDIVLVDKCEELIKIHNWIMFTPTENILTDIYTVIDQYKLSKINKDGFLSLRTDFNNLVNQGTFSAPMLYCLIMHSFNYSLHLNKKGEFNAPFGKERSCFSSAMQNKLIAFKEYMDKLKDKNFLITAQDSLEYASKLVPEYLHTAVFFIDPPYSASISKHPYRVGNVSWKEDDDRKLFNLLDWISKNNGRFIFTNVLRNNGKENIPLQEWAKGYNITPVAVDYSNCNYQRKNNGETNEVIITNF